MTGGVWLVLRGELRLLSRSSLFVALMVVVPLLMGPGMAATLWFTDAIDPGTTVEEPAEGSETEAGPEEKAKDRIAGPVGLNEWIKPNDRLEWAGEAGTEDVLVTVAVEGGVPGPEAPAQVVYASADRKADVAADRVKTVLRRWRAADHAAQYEALGLPLAPNEVLRVEVTDLATGEERGGGQLSPMLAMGLIVLMTFMACWVGLDVFAGEKERGTLETLLVTRLTRRAIVLGKFLTCVLTTLVVGWLGLASIVVCVATMPAIFGDMAAPLSGSLVTAGLLVPQAVIVAALMSTLGASVDDYRSGSVLAAPVLLVVMAPAALALFGAIELTPMTILVPIASASLAIRETMAGQISALQLAGVGLATTAHAALTLWVAIAAMQREETLIGGGSSSRNGAGAVRLALVTVAGAWTANMYFGPSAIAMGREAGIFVIMVGLMATPGLLALVVAGQPLASGLRLRAPSLRDTGLAVVAGLTAPAVGSLVYWMQQPILPSPSDFEKSFSDALMGDMSLPVQLVLLALLPGLCEELLFRGAVLTLLRRAARPAMAVALTGILFGLMHFPIYRMPATAMLGVLFGIVAWRSGSIWPAMIVHALNNAVLLVISSQQEGSDSENLTLGSVALLVMFGSVSVASAWAMSGRHERPEPPNATR